MARGIEQVKQGNLDAHLAYPATAELDGELSSSAKVYALHSQFFISSRLSVFSPIPLIKVIFSLKIL